MDGGQFGDNHKVKIGGGQFGDNHKVKIGKKRSKTNGIKLGKMTSGCGCPQVLAERALRGGNFAVSYAYPSDWRSTRDLLRRRGHLANRRGETLAHIQIVNHQQNLPLFTKRLQYKANRQDIAKRFDDPAVAFSIQTDVDMLDAYDVTCLLYTSPSPRDKRQSRMPSSA